MTSTACREQSPRTHRQCGGVLVEFALIAIALYVLVAGLLSLSTATLSQQIAQDAARVGARELALAPLPIGATFEEAVTRVFDPAALVVDLDTLGPTETIEERFATLPLLHRSLRPLYIYDDVEIEGARRRLLRYPGALVRLPDGQLSVAIPRVVTRSDGEFGSAGIEQIEWRSVVEEVRPDPADPNTGTFAWDGTDGSGVVALRVWVPYQSSALSGYRQNVDDPLDPNLANPIVADDSAVTTVGVTSPSLDNLGLVNSTSAFPTYSGPYGLGRVQALGRELRPYRVLLVAQAVFPREVFE